MKKLLFPTATTPSRCLLLIALTGSLTLTACASTPLSSLPIHTAAGQGSVSSVRAYERGNKLVVAGSAHPLFTSGGNHLDIQLLDANGRVLAEKTETIKLGHPRGSQARHGSDSFVTSFPLDAIHGAASVRIALHSSSH